MLGTPYPGVMPSHGDMGDPAVPVVPGSGCFLGRPRLRFIGGSGARGMDGNGIIGGVFITVEGDAAGGARVGVCVGVDTDACDGDSAALDVRGRADACTDDGTAGEATVPSGALWCSI